MPSVTATVTTKQQVTISPKVVRKLLVELNGYAALSKEIKLLRKGDKDAGISGLEDHSANVLRLATEGVDGDKFEIEGFKVAVVKGARDRRLDKDALIKRLVKDGKYSVRAAQALMDDCTRETEKKTHCRITVPGEKDNDE